MKILKTILLILLPVVSFCQLKKTVVVVTILGKNMNGVGYYTTAKKYDTLKIQHNKLIFKDTISNPQIAQLEIKYFGDGRPKDKIFLFLVDDTIKIKISPVKEHYNFEIFGPKLSVDYEWKLSEPVTFYNKKIDSILTKLETPEIRKLSDTSFTKQKIKADLADQMWHCFKIPQDYIDRNPNSILSITALEMLGSGGPKSPVPLTDLIGMYNSLSKEVKESTEGALYSKRLDQLQQSAQIKK